MHERHRAGLAVADAGGAGPLAVEGKEGAEEDVQRGRGERWVGGQVPADAHWKRQHPMAHGNARQDALDQMRGGVVRAARGAGRADPAALAGERDQQLVAAVAAADAGEAVGEDPAVEVAGKLALDKAGEPGAVGAALARLAEEGSEVPAPQADGVSRGHHLRRDGPPGPRQDLGRRGL